MFSSKTFAWSKWSITQIKSNIFDLFYWEILIKDLNNEIT